MWDINHSWYEQAVEDNRDNCGGRSSWDDPDDDYGSSWQGSGHKNCWGVEMSVEEYEREQAQRERTQRMMSQPGYVDDVPF